jgi:Flp pilus assembly protein protease CpaA
LLAATALLIGYGNLFGFLFLMSIFGGLVSIVLLLIHRFKTGFPVPYGVAIAGAAIVTVLPQSSFFALSTFFLRVINHA